MNHLRMMWLPTLVTPAMAIMWLATAGLTIEDFRRDAACFRYARAIKAGKWRRNGDGAIFDWNGRLIDGRQRLAAIIIADIAIPMDVWEGVDPSVDYSIDRHKRRTNADVVFSLGIDNASRIAAVCNAIYCMIHGLNINHKESRHDMVGMAEANPDIADALATAQSIKSIHSSFRNGPVAAAIFLTSRIDPEKSERMFSGLVHWQTETNQYTPWRALGRHFRGMMKNVKESNTRRLYAHAYIVKAWNAFADGARVSAFEFSPESEALPRLRGFDPDMVRYGSDDGVLSIAPSTDYRQAAYDQSIKGSVVLMTPEWARQLLGQGNGPADTPGLKAIRNRKKSDVTVDSYTRDMTRENGWAPNGQSIKLSRSGRVLDGQHRLMACIKANRPFVTVLVEGLPDSVFDTYDTHSKKNHSHHLKGKGVENSSAAASSMRIVWRALNHHLASMEHPTPSEMAEMERLHLEAMKPSVSLGIAKGFRKILPPAIVTALHYILSHEDREAADAFFEKIKTGSELKATDPILILRNKLIHKDEKTRSFTNDQDWITWVIRAWVAYRGGTNLVAGHLRRSAPLMPGYDGRIVLSAVGIDQQVSATQSSPAVSKGKGATPSTQDLFAPMRQQIAAAPVGRVGRPVVTPSKGGAHKDGEAGSRT